MISLQADSSVCSEGCLLSLAFHSGLGAAGWLYLTPNYPDYRRSAKVLHMRCFWQGIIIHHLNLLSIALHSQTRPDRKVKPRKQRLCLRLLEKLRSPQKDETLAAPNRLLSMSRNNGNAGRALVLLSHLTIASQMMSTEAGF